MLVNQIFCFRFDYLCTRVGREGMKKSFAVLILRGIKIVDDFFIICFFQLWFCSLPSFLVGAQCPWWSTWSQRANPETDGGETLGRKRSPCQRPERWVKVCLKLLLFSRNSCSIIWFQLGSAWESEHHSELTEEEAEVNSSFSLGNKTLKGFLYYDFKFFRPFFTRRWV